MGLSLKQTQTAYWAGIVDGEGNISITRRHSKSYGYKTPIYQLVVHVTNTKREMCEMLQDEFRAGHVTVVRRYDYDRKRKQAIYWTVYANQAVKVLRQIMPYLRFKRKHAQIGIESQTTKGHFGPGHPPHPRQITPEELSRREGFFQKMRTLNKRGVDRADVEKYEASRRTDHKEPLIVEYSLGKLFRCPECNATYKHRKNYDKHNCVGWSGPEGFHI